MKRLILFPILALILQMTACTPEDKNLNRPNGPTQQGNSSPQNLRVGTYGIPIWAFQNIEQVGSLVQACLASDKFAVAQNGNLFLKNCQLKYSISSDPSSKNAALTKERWDVKLTLRQNGTGFAVQAADGQMQTGTSTALVGKLNAYLTYKDKSFSFTLNEQNQLALDLSASGEVGSEADNLKLTQELSATGESVGSAWNLAQVDYQLVFLNKGQTFEVSGKNLNLNWVTPFCAEPNGTLTTLEVGKPSAQISLSATQAQQVISGKKKPWSQKFSGCLARSAGDKVRSSAALDFQFLFF